MQYQLILLAVVIAPGGDAAPDERAVRREAVARTKEAVGLVNRAKATGGERAWLDAFKAADAALALDPDMLDAAKVKLMCMANEHRFAQIVTATDSLLARAPADPFFWASRGDALVELGDYDAAEAAYQAMLDRKPSALAYGRSGYLRWIEGDTDGALAAYDLALRSSSPRDRESFAWALCDLGDAYLSIGEAAIAADYFHAALSHLPALGRAHLGLGHAERSLGHDDEAIRAYSNAVLYAPTAQSFAWLATMFADDRMDAPLVFAETLLRAQGDDRLEASLLADLDLDPNRAVALAEAEHERRHDVFTKDVLAWALLKAGRVDQAVRFSAEALRYGTADARLYFHAGMIAESAGQHPRARRLLVESMQLGPRLTPLETAQARRVLASQNP